MSHLPPEGENQGWCCTPGPHRPAALPNEPLCVLSAPAPLGPLQKIRLWHDSRGHSPAWYVSHVMVKELCAGQGQSWLFPAECWLAVSRWDGRVERELACLCRGPGFWKVGGIPGQLAECPALLLWAVVYLNSLKLGVFVLFLVNIKITVS